jgi:hypothetical protein
MSSVHPSSSVTRAAGLPGCLGLTPINRSDRKRCRSLLTVCLETPSSLATAMLLVPRPHVRITRARAARHGETPRDRNQARNVLRSAELRTRGRIGRPRRSTPKPLRRLRRNSLRHLPIVRFVIPISPATTRFVFPSAQPKIACARFARARGTR